MKPRLQTSLGQHLVMTPQLRQAIRLLQLSTAELEVEIASAVESNPLLDWEEPAPLETHVDGGDSRSDGHGDSGSDDEDRAPADASAWDGDETWYERIGPADSDDEPLAEQVAEVETLQDHLLWQLHLSHLSQRDRSIGVAIIEAIDDDGYLHESNETLQQNLASLYHVEADEIEAVRHRVQRFDPIGVASRTLSECLRVQLDALDPETPGLATARSLASEHLEELARNDRARLCRQLHTEAADLDAAIALIRSLDPKPGAQVSPGNAEYVSPDAYAVKHNGRWTVSLSPNCQPKLAINQQYASLIARARRDDASYLRGQLQEARWLIKSLETRADTMLKVANAIVRAQSGFLDFGAEAMRPLVLRDIAEEIGMHESTVSRVTTRKYLHTPRGTFEFKYFFSSGVSTVDGGAASATAIQAMIKKLIGDEKATRPLSDQALAIELNRRGIEVARRTVAKYREALHIPSSNERSRLG